MATPDTRSSIVIVKKFTWRDSDRFWANRYHFTGPETLDPGHWDTLRAAIVDAEKAIHPADTFIVEALGYDASTATPTNPHGIAVYAHTLSVAGTLDTTGMTAVPGECAAVLRWSTDARTTKNHPIYLFSYYHGVGRSVTGDKDKVALGQLDALNLYGLAWHNGFSDGTDTRVRCGPRGAVAQAHLAHEFITHRDFPR